MYEKQISEMIAFGAKMAEEGIAATGDTISMRVAGGMLVSAEEADLGVLKEGDVDYVAVDQEVTGAAKLHQRIYATREDISAVITNHAPYCGIAGNTVKKLPPALDDIAQIVGPTTKVAPASDVETVLKTLKGRNACLIKGNGAVATGRTVDEAFTGCMVLEKGAKAYVEATVLGGAKLIPYLEAVLMHIIYKKKYSKADQTAKMEEMKA